MTKTVNNLLTKVNVELTSSYDIEGKHALNKLLT